MCMEDLSSLDHNMERCVGLSKDRSPYSGYRDNGKNGNYRDYRYYRDYIGVI